MDEERSAPALAELVEETAAPRARRRRATPEGAPSEPAPEPLPEGTPEPAARDAVPSAEDPTLGGAPEAEPEFPADEPQAAGAGERLSDDELVRQVAALLFASPHPLPPRKLVDLLERPRPARVMAALVELGRRLEAGGLPIELRRIAGGWHLFTAPDQGEVVARLAPGERTERLSAAGLETLAVVAYRQPVTKAEIEAIRGVQAGPMLRALVDRGLVKVVGRADLPGSPLQYGTTKEFLDRFGLGSLEDLPRDGELL